MCSTYPSNPQGASSLFFTAPHPQQFSWILLVPLRVEETREGIWLNLQFATGFSFHRFQGGKSASFEAALVESWTRAGGSWSPCLRIPLSSLTFLCCSGRVQCIIIGVSYSIAMRKFTSLWPYCCLFITWSSPKTVRWERELMILKVIIEDTQTVQGCGSSWRWSCWA